MAAKRKNSGGKGSPPQKKKAKVVDPVQEHIKVISDALGSDAGDQLPANVVEMLANVVKPALSNAVEGRSALEAKFAGLVGEALQEAAQALRNGADNAEAAHIEQQGAALAASATQESCKAAVNTAESALESASEAKVAAEAAADDTEKAVTKFDKEHKDLDKTRAKYESEVETLQNALDVVQSPTSQQKEGKKVQAVLKNCGACGSVIDGLPQSLGSTDGFNALVLTEAAKCITGRKAEVSGKLANWDGYVASISATAEGLANSVTAAKELVASRSGALQGANDALKTAKAEAKAATEAAKEATKAVDAKAKKASTAASVKDSADCALASFQFLFNRSDQVNGLGEDAEIAA